MPVKANEQYFQMFTYLWLITYLAVCLQHAQGQGTFNFPDNPQPTPEDENDVLPGLEGKYW